MKKRTHAIYRTKSKRYLRGSKDNKPKYFWSKKKWCDLFS